MNLLPLGLMALLAWMVPASASGFDYNFDGRLRFDGRFVDSPDGYRKFDQVSELRLGGNGQFMKGDGWDLDYEILVDTRYASGPAEKAGFIDEFDVEPFRGWVRLDHGDWRLRAGRQQILFGAGALFRPLGFFDNRVIASVFPQTVGVDSVRYSYFPDASTTLQGWVVPARENGRAIAGGRWEGLLGDVETGVVLQYSPVTDLPSIPNYDLDLIQLGYHAKGEYEVGLWNEGRLDVQQLPGSADALRFDTVFGADYTFNVGEGLHVLLEYFLSASENNFTNRDPQGRHTIHQMGLQMDQPVGIATVWRLFAFYDMRDETFQIAPQIEYALTDRTYIYLQGNWGGDLGGGDPRGRLFRKTSAFNGTEPAVGLTLIVFL